MKVDCVILAAGLSSRMGGNKMLLKIGGRTVIERCMDAFYDRCSSIIVVTGKYRGDIEGCLAPYSKVRIVYNGDYGQGMFGSVKEGVRHVTAERFFLTPGDYPLSKADTVARMIRVPGCIVAPVYRGRQGHPVLLDKRLIPGIVSATCSSLRDHLQGVQAGRQEVCVDDAGVVADIDTAEEYQSAVKRYARECDFRLYNG